MGIPFLETKLSTPTTKPEMVERAGLVELLNKSLWQNGHFDRVLTLVCAPAGFGKTTLITQWLDGLEPPEANDVAHSWLSVAEADNDPIRFLGYLIAALQKIDASIAASCGSMLEGPDVPSAEAVISQIFWDIDHLEVWILLVIDDFHCIHNQEIHQFLSFALTHMPKNLHLAISTRIEPEFSLSKLRACGRILEIRQSELSFSNQEAARFFELMKLPDLSALNVSILNQCTEGWVAGLQLAAISLQKCDDIHEFLTAFSDNHRHVLDYLMDEVYTRQDKDIQDFLLKCSVLNRITAPLCDFMLSRNDSRSILDVIEKTNLFLVPLDNNRRWYRFHHLFVNLLRERLHAKIDPPSLQDLHKRVAMWYDNFGCIEEAVYHAFAAEAWCHAVSIICKQAGQMIEQGVIVLLIGWLEALPQSTIQSDPNLGLILGWALTFCAKLDAGKMHLDAAESLWNSSQQIDNNFITEVYAVRALNLGWRGDTQGALEGARSVLSRSTSDNDLICCVARLAAGIANRDCGRYYQAIENLHKVGCTHSLSNHIVRLTALTTLGAIKIDLGALHEAHELLNQAIELGGRSPATCQAHIELARILYEWNDMDASRLHTQNALKLNLALGNADTQIKCLCLTCLQHIQANHLSEAEKHLQNALNFAQQNFITNEAQIYLYACAVHAAAVTFDFSTARNWYTQLPDFKEALHLELQKHIYHCLYLCLQNKTGDNTIRLEKLHHASREAGLENAALKSKCIQSMYASPKTKSLDFLKEALHLAEPQNFVRTFLDFGTPMVKKLKKILALDPHPHAKTIMAGYQSGKQRLGYTLPSTSIQASLIEPLSNRELEVLQLMALGLSNQKIAKQLYVGLGTVKTHVHSILSKLEAKNRIQAVIHAKQRGWLSINPQS